MKVMLPGSRLYVGPGGKLKESLGAALAFNGDDDDPQTKEQAKAELKRMRRTLRQWLKFRQMNDEMATGARKARAPAFLLAQTLDRDRDYEVEQKLAEDLFNLLSLVADPQTLPKPDVRLDPDVAVKLAQMVVTGQPAPEVAAPQAQGFVPILIMTVGAVLLLSITSIVSNRAEVAKERERQKCLREGDFVAKILCADVSNILMFAAVGYGAYYAWTNLGIGEKVMGAVGAKPKRRRTRRRR